MTGAISVLFRSCRAASGGLSTVAPVETVSAKQAGVSLGDFPADLQAIRRCFPDRWAAFLRAHFRCPSHVAAFFSVDERTSRDWWNGKHGVNSAPVIFAMRIIPGAVAELLENAA
jgi:hypothetical protein